MKTKFYRKFFAIYYATSMAFVTLIVCLLAGNNAAADASVKSLQFQSYAHNIILYLKDGRAVPDTDLALYERNRPIFLLITGSGGLAREYCSGTIRTRQELLKESIGRRVQQSIGIEPAGPGDVCALIPSVYSCRLSGEEDEEFRCYYTAVRTAAGEEYRLYMGYLLNRGLFSALGILPYLFLELLVGAIFFCVGKYIVKAAVRPIEENMENQKRFIASASHELKTPLSVISLANASKQPDSRRIIEQECAHMDQIVKSLLFIASGESRTWKTDFEPIRPENLLIEFYELSQPLLREYKMSMEFQFPEEEMRPVMFDRTLMLQLFNILLDNAIAHSETGRRITVRLEEKKNLLVMYFIDYGQGIPDADKPHIFDSFYKSGDASSGHYGLGLSIARTIVKLHHGRLSAADTPGGGATFVAEFPVRVSGTSTP